MVFIEIAQKFSSCLKWKQNRIIDKQRLIHTFIIWFPFGWSQPVSWTSDWEIDIIFCHALQIDHLKNSYRMEILIDDDHEWLKFFTENNFDRCLFYHIYQQAKDWLRLSTRKKKSLRRLLSRALIKSQTVRQTKRCFASNEKKIIVSTRKDSSCDQ